MIRKDLVGVVLAVHPGLPADLRQQFLFVDRIGVVGLENVTESEQGALATWPHDPALILRLADAGVVFPVPNRLHARLLVEDDEAGPELQGAIDATRRSEEHELEMKVQIVSEDGRAFLRSLNESRDEIEQSRSFLPRAHAAVLRSDGIDAVSLLPTPAAHRSAAVARDAALRIIITALPVPSTNVPLLEIVNFRRDPDNLERLLAIRAWASRIARSQLTAHEMVEELEHVLSEYTRALQLLEKRHDFGTLELTLTTVPELVANLLTLNFTEAAKRLFELRNPKLKLLEDERNVPGREVSYVVAAHRRFGGGA